MEVTALGAVVITFNPVNEYNASDRNSSCSVYTSLINVCNEVTAIVALVITHRLIDVLGESEYLCRTLTYRPYNNILHSLFVQMYHEVIRQVYSGTEAGGNSYGPLEYQPNMSGGARDGHNTPQSGQQVPGWDLNQVLHKCKSCVTTVLTHYVSVARVNESANGNEREIYESFLMVLKFLLWFTLRH